MTLSYHSKVDNELQPYFQLFGISIFSKQTALPLKWQNSNTDTDLSMHCTAGEVEVALLLSPNNCFAIDPAIATANSAFHYLKWLKLCGYLNCC